MKHQKWLQSSRSSQQKPPLHQSRQRLSLFRKKSPNPNWKQRRRTFPCLRLKTKVGIASQRKRKKRYASAATKSKKASPRRNRLVIAALAAVRLKNLLLFPRTTKKTVLASSCGLKRNRKKSVMLSRGQPSPW